MFSFLYKKPFFTNDYQYNSLKDYIRESNNKSFQRIIERNKNNKFKLILNKINEDNDNNNMIYDDNNNNPNNPIIPFSILLSITSFLYFFYYNRR
jgi:hypothetical protein